MKEKFKGDVRDFQGESLTRKKMKEWKKERKKKRKKERKEKNKKYEKEKKIYEYA
jgi:hypothetical protein